MLFRLSQASSGCESKMALAWSSWSWSRRARWPKYARIAGYAVRVYRDRFTCALELIPDPCCDRWKSRFPKSSLNVSNRLYFIISTTSCASCRLAFSRISSRARAFRNTSNNQNDNGLCTLRKLLLLWFINYLNVIPLFGVIYQMSNKWDGVSSHFETPGEFKMRSAPEYFGRNLRWLETRGDIREIYWVQSWLQLCSIHTTTEIHAF